MQPTESDMWGPVGTPSADSIGFEDSFSPSNNSAEDNNNDDGVSYVPLQDSTQYLAGLERKLARVQGRTSGQRKTESRRLLDALVRTRSVHVNELLQGTEGTSEDPEQDQPPPGNTTTATVDPQGALGVVLRRIVPDRVALAPEELCRLLEADTLANIHQALQEESEALAAQSTPEKTDTPELQRSSDRSTTPALHNADNNTTQDTPNTIQGTSEGNNQSQTIEVAKSQVEQKDPSSDEGEK